MRFLCNKVFLASDRIILISLPTINARTKFHSAIEDVQALSVKAALSHRALWQLQKSLRRRCCSMSESFSPRTSWRAKLDISRRTWTFQAGRKAMRGELFCSVCFSLAFLALFAGQVLSLWVRPSPQRQRGGFPLTTVMSLWSR